MVLSIGTDILNIKTIEYSVSDYNDPFVQKIYTEKELQLIFSRPIPLYCFATRFAAKEAIFKCFGVDGDAFRLNEVEILENEVAQPIVILHGKASALAKEKGIRTILISLSYDTDYAIAYATAIG